MDDTAHLVKTWGAMTDDLSHCTRAAEIYLVVRETATYMHEQSAQNVFVGFLFNV